MTKLYDKHAAQIRTGIANSTLVSGLKRALTNEERKNQGWSIGVTASKMTADELNSLLDAVGLCQPVVDKEMQTKGFKYLWDKFKTPKGKTRLRNPFTDKQALVLFNFSHFALIDFISIGRYTYPIYKVIATNGKWFSYYSTPWQAGGLFEVLNDMEA